MGSVSLGDKLIITVWTMVRFFFASKQKPGKSHEKEERRDTCEILLTATSGCRPRSWRNISLTECTNIYSSTNKG